ncbi:hypothetical protein STENM327S_04597 [Streptomyces tendae]
MPSLTAVSVPRRNGGATWATAEVNRRLTRPEADNLRVLMLLNPAS